MTPIRRLFLIALVIFSPAATASTLLHLDVKRGNTLVASGVAALVADNHLLTSLALTSLGPDLVLSMPGNTQTLSATLIAQAEEHDLALLRTNGLTGSAFVLAREMPERGRTLDVVQRDNRLQRGVLLSHPGAVRISHSALYGINAYGAPALNNCGELIGINTAAVRGLLTRRLDSPALPLNAAPLNAVRSLLASQGLSPETATGTCLSQEAQLERASSQARESAEEQARLAALEEEVRQRNAELERAQKQIAEALAEQQRQLEAQSDSLDESQRSNEELEREKQRLIEAAEAIREDKEALESRQTELETQQQALEQALQGEQTRRQQLLRFGLPSIALLLVILLVTALTLRRRRRQLSETQQQSEQIREQLSAASQTWQDILLTGEDPDGQPLRLKINGTALVRSSQGQILGRHPQSADYVLNVAEISREHLHLQIKDDQLFIKDLGSRNGTRINDTKIPVDQPAALQDGDSLALGTIPFKVTFLGTDK